MLMKLRIEKIVAHGKGLARQGGKVVFAEGALPGEIVDAEIIAEKRDFAEAQVSEVLQPSPYRTEAPCPYYRVCGGCDFQHLTFEGQRIMKLQMLQDTLRRGLGEEWDTELPNRSKSEDIPFRQAESLALSQKSPLSHQPKFGFHRLSAACRQRDCTCA